MKIFYPPREIFRKRASNITAEEGVDAAFAFVEAGPAAGAFVFAVGGGAGAGLAADGAVAECGESVHGEVVFFDVVLDFVASPGGHGVELHDVKVAEGIEVVEFHDFGFLARVVAFKYTRAGKKRKMRVEILNHGILFLRGKFSGDRRATDGTNRELDLWHTASPHERKSFNLAHCASPIAVHASRKSGGLRPSLRIPKLALELGCFKKCRAVCAWRESCAIWISHRLPPPTECKDEVITKQAAAIFCKSF